MNGEVTVLVYVLCEGYNRHLFAAICSVMGEELLGML